MNRLVLLLGLAVGFSAADTALAIDWSLGGPFRLRNRVPDCIGRYCRDDYCPKPLPPVCPPKCFTCDDYCPKRLPCIFHVKRFCCDDYCPKCLPRICCPPPPGLKCGPAGCRHGCQTAGPTLLEAYP